MKVRQALALATTVAVSALGAFGEGEAKADETARAPFASDAVLPLDMFEGAAPESVVDELLVDLKNDVTETDVADIAREYGLTLKPNSEFSLPERIERGIFAAGATTEPSTRGGMSAFALSVLERLRRDVRVEHAEPMAVLGAYFVPNDPL